MMGLYEAIDELEPSINVVSSQSPQRITRVVDTVTMNGDGRGVRPFPHKNASPPHSCAHRGTSPACSCSRLAYTVYTYMRM